MLYSKKFAQVLLGLYLASTTLASNFNHRRQQMHINTLIFIVAEQLITSSQNHVLPASFSCRLTTHTNQSNKKLSRRLGICMKLIFYCAYTHCLCKIPPVMCTSMYMVYQNPLFIATIIKQWTIRPSLVTKQNQ